MSATFKSLELGVGMVYLFFLVFFVSYLYEVAPEQKARSTYDNILRVVRNIPEVADPIRFLRAREVVHFQRFGEALRSIQEQLDAKNFYAFNPGFDNPCSASCAPEAK